MPITTLESFSYLYTTLKDAVTDGFVMSPDRFVAVDKLNFNLTTIPNIQFQITEATPLSENSGVMVMSVIYKLHVVSRSNRDIVFNQTAATVGDFTNESVFLMAATAMEIVKAIPATNGLSNHVPLKIEQAVYEESKNLVSIAVAFKTFIGVVSNG